MQPRIIFITGTDTGVGKTVLTGLLLSHLRQNGCHALALKPFCSGGRADAQLLHELQDGELTLDEINPFHFEEPVAPLVAARLHRRKIPLNRVLDHIRQIASSLTNPIIRQSINPVLLVEGAGGLLSPLGECRSSSRFTFHVSPRKGSRSKTQTSIYSALDLIKALDCEVLVVTANRLGTINHTLLAVSRLREARIKVLAVAFMDIIPPLRATPDMEHNYGILCKLLKPASLVRLPYLGKHAPSAQSITENAKKLRTLLCRLQPESKPQTRTLPPTLSLKLRSRP